MKKESSCASLPQPNAILNSTAPFPLDSANLKSRAVNPPGTNTESSVHIGFRIIHLGVDMLVWLVLATVAVVLLDHYLPTLSHFAINALAYSAMAGLFLGYYFTFEYFFQRTLGKFLTGTKVVDMNGGEPTGKAILIRTLVRLIPVDFLSYLFVRNGIHDALSRTQVIKIKKK